MNPKTMKRLEVAEARLDALSALTKSMHATLAEAVAHAGKAQAAIDALAATMQAEQEALAALRTAQAAIEAAVKYHGESLHLLLTGNPMPHYPQKSGPALRLVKEFKPGRSEPLDQVYGDREG